MPSCGRRKKTYKALPINATSQAECLLDCHRHSNSARTTVVSFVTYWMLTHDFYLALTPAWYGHDKVGGKIIVSGPLYYQFILDVNEIVHRPQLYH